MGSLRPPMSARRDIERNKKMATGVVRGAMFKHTPRAGEDPNKKHPLYDIQLEIMGVKLRLVAWPKEKSKTGAVEYLPISGDYARDELKRLVDVAVTVGGGANAAASAGTEPEDIPF